MIFDKERHLYIIPSVSEILRNTLFPATYEGVPEHILENARQRGVAIHDAIEKGNDFMLDDELLPQYNEWLRIKEENKIQPINHEQMVQVDAQYAGTYDMFAFVNNETVLIDIKTTAKLDKTYLSWQLSMYALAIENMGLDSPKIYCVWLPKGKKGKFVEIEKIPTGAIIELVEKYYKEKENGYY